MSTWDPSGKVDVFDVLEVLEIDNVRREGYAEARFSCPYPGHENGDQSASAYMNLETTAWFCHGCKRKGNVISFAASLLSITPMKAKRLLRQAYDPSSLNPDERRMTDEIRDLVAKRSSQPVMPTNEPFDESMIERFEVDWLMVHGAGEDAPAELAYMLGRGFDWETLDYWGFGFDERTHRITFPVRDEWGHLVGVKGRAADDRHPKYLVIGDDPRGESHYGFPRYYTGSVVFGLHEAIDHFELLEHGEPAELIVCEGELNAIALWQMGYRNSVALNGSNLTSYQERMIRTYCDRAIFYFDPDKAGDKALWGWRDDDGVHRPGALERLTRDINVLIVGSHDGDPAQCLEEGREGEVESAINDTKPYLMAALERRRASV